MMLMIRAEDRRHGRKLRISSSGARSFSGGSLATGPRWMRATILSFGSSPSARSSHAGSSSAKGVRQYDARPRLRRAEQHRVDRTGRREEILVVHVRIAGQHRRRDDEGRGAAQLDRLLLAAGRLQPGTRVRAEDAEAPGLCQLVIGRMARQFDKLAEGRVVDRLRAVLLVRRRRRMAALTSTARDGSRSGSGRND